MVPNLTCACFLLWVVSWCSRNPVCLCITLVSSEKRSASYIPVHVPGVSHCDAQVFIGSSCVDRSRGCNPHAREPAYFSTLW
ncbi:hypothetical protein BJ875DRAFT_42873 [Amylocarpus encephaloides]|uniref:Secreted protein n=1 Tax=Amylocarpus encephaloides TaxID=45428 RepID=A0A9P7YH73_9HELO|nr:hypothetical protein BJ875DRAFT_42873 [Amylocarpus encephaloides]